MRRLRPFVVLVVALVAAYFVWRLWPKPSPDTLSGYIDGDLLYLSAPVAGSVTELSAVKGERVAKGAALFQIDPRPAAAQTEQARAALEAAEAAARDTEKGQRPPELAVVAAQREEAQARLRQAKAEYERIRILTAKGFYAQTRLDQARADYESVEAQVAEFERRLKVAELAQRPDQIAAAKARTAQAEHTLTEASVRLGQQTGQAPVDARIQDVFFQRGEWAPANQPVVALLPDERVRLRFYVPETEVARYRPGRTLRFSCDGCASGLTARIDFVNPIAEFTPPVIYSRESRKKLVFLVEAMPDRPRELTPGLPIDVERLRN
jgi:HlyD family secretion protein